MFHIEIKDKKGVENVVVDHLSKIPSQDLTEGPIHDSFPKEHLLHVSTLTSAPWYADIANYLAVGSIPSH